MQAFNDYTGRKHWIGSNWLTCPSMGFSGMLLQMSAAIGRTTDGLPPRRRSTPASCACRPPALNRSHPSVVPMTSAAVASGTPVKWTGRMLALIRASGIPWSAHQLSTESTWKACPGLERSASANHEHAAREGRRGMRQSSTQRPMPADVAGQQRTGRRAQPAARGVALSQWPPSASAQKRLQ